MVGILGIGASGVGAYKSALDTIGHNISNANTEGYSRQRVNLSTRLPSFEGYGYVGNGVYASSVDRLYDRFVNSQIRSSSSSQAQFDAYYSYAAQLDNLLADGSLSLDSSMQNFFDAVQELADNPSSSTSRTFLLSESSTLVDRMYYLNDQLNNTRSRLNQDLSGTISEINAIASSLAGANQSIVTAAGVGNGMQPNDLLDLRDQLLKDLSERINITTLTQDNGAINVFIGSGQALVVDGAAIALSMVNSAEDASKKDISFSTASGSIVITDQLTGGRVGGMLSFQDEVLDSAQNELGRVVVGLVQQFNAQHQLGVDLSGSLGCLFFTAPDPNVLDNANNSVAAAGLVTVAFSNDPLSDFSDLTASDYELRSTDGADNYTLTRLSDSTVFNIDVTAATTLAADGYATVPGVPATVTVDGFTLSITAGSAAGDQFLIQPTRDAAYEVALNIADPSIIAAAGPIRATVAVGVNGMPTNAGTAEMTQPKISSTTNLPLSGSGGDITLTFNPNAGGAGVPGFDVTNALPAFVLYDPATESAGKTLGFTVGTKGDMSFSISGLPAAGDSFVITDNTASVGDNRNALALATIQQSQTMKNGTASLQETYSQMVGGIGADTRRAEINMESHQGLLDQAILTRDSISGVSLDEEAADLLRYQQAYQAAAQVVSIASTLFDALLSAVRR